MKTMGCPACGHDLRDVVDTRIRQGRDTAGIPYIARRCRCRACGHLWSTHEFNACQIDYLLHAWEVLQRIAGVIQEATNEKGA